MRMGIAILGDGHDTEVVGLMEVDVEMVLVMADWVLGVLMMVDVVDTCPTNKHMLFVHSNMDQISSSGIFWQCADLKHFFCDNYCVLS